ncbi:avidin/streptavidin family protein [Sphingomonas sp. QA11]|uniref:avidin/streptavidin family protein n=1 Tax=Sphingomonas sp. QA11 TaxID=2950605 RepID=UPI0023499B82|nr:avidin/streptavidin family protein [Sphingomonas sp. QA11]WCM29622.1 avidin/streptavidin family protein [Sphingomonas sp. QA11]
MTALSVAGVRWTGTWQNELGSLLRIEHIISVVVPGGSGTEHYRVAGLYQTAKGSVPLKERFPVTGFVTADQIVFTVSYRYVPHGEEDDDKHSLVAWAGQILPTSENPAKEELKTLWHLVPDLRTGEEEEQYGWVIAWSGEDRFRKLSNDPEFDVLVTK